MLHEGAEDEIELGIQPTDRSQTTLALVNHVIRHIHRALAVVEPHRTHVYRNAGSSMPGSLLPLHARTEDAVVRFIVPVEDFHPVGGSLLHIRQGAHVGILGCHLPESLLGNMAQPFHTLRSRLPHHIHRIKTA